MGVTIANVVMVFFDNIITTLAIVISLVIKTTNKRYVFLHDRKLIKH